MVIFEYQHRKYILATDAGIAARRHAAQSVTVDGLRELRRPPSAEADWSRMQILSEAGILVCPSSGIPVFDPTSAPASLWTFFTSLAKALNTPSEDASTAAAVAAEHVAVQLRGANVPRDAALANPSAAGVPPAATSPLPTLPRPVPTSGSSRPRFRKRKRPNASALHCATAVDVSPITNEARQLDAASTAGAGAARPPALRGGGDMALDGSGAMVLPTDTLGPQVRRPGLNWRHHAIFGVN